jgi:hypothetical protein
MSETGIFEAFERRLASSLHCANLRHRSAAFRNSPSEGPHILREVFADVEKAWGAATAENTTSRSSENFRWFKPQLTLGQNNKSPETTLERALIGACCRLGRTDWANQVPLISGLEGPHTHKRRAVDLVHRSASDHAEFVELKVGSDTPLFAASEIVLYGLLWLLARRDRHRLSFSASPLLNARHLRLSVLAPQAFYAGMELRDMAEFFNGGLMALGHDCGLELEFGFDAFSGGFCWPAALSDEALVEFLDGREIVR